MGWFSKGKRRVRRRVSRNRKLRRKIYRKTGTGRIMRNKHNRRHKIVGPDPRYLISPIDFVPVVGQVNKGYRGYKYAKKTWRAKKGIAKGVARSYDKHSRRGGRTSSSSRKGRRPRRGTYYYYRGKRIYRK